MRIHLSEATSKLVKEPSAKLAGPYVENREDYRRPDRRSRERRHKKSVEDKETIPGATTGTAKLLLRKNPYPNAGTVTGCIKLSDWLEEEREVLMQMLLTSFTKSPGAWVYGAQLFPEWREPAEVFLWAAGFSREDATLLCAHLPEGGDGGEEVELESEDELEEEPQ